MSNHEYDDELSGIFDSLTPQDFVAAFNQSTAVNENSPVGREIDFDDFVDDQVRALRLAYAAAEGNIQPIAIVSGPDAQRMFVPDGDETLRAWVDRVQREARQIGATWLFISKKTLVAARDLDDTPPPDVNDSNEVQEAINSGVMEIGVFWYAEHREGRDRRRFRHGILRGDETRLNELVEGSQAQAVPIFAKILD